ncbi:hypothetical protein QAD02_006084 [Eretmocerus hayati]|uniref:Uncharacterized protein n=1 Tax=Eretmocerus hayati TaxID=131215 RepID=A0ACC2N262_9HYME|nr:hypothetical protein QAD02_006084 [Eretmocerus hayati]
MDQPTNGEPSSASQAILKVQLWLSGAPGGPWPAFIDNEPSESSRATAADSISLPEDSDEEITDLSDDSGKSTTHMCTYAPTVELPQGPAPQPQQPDRSYEDRTASLSRALINIRVQYASSDEDEDAATTPPPGLKMEDGGKSSTTSAYSSAEGESESKSPEPPRGPADARAARPSPSMKIKRRSRAARAARNASWHWTVTEQHPPSERAPTTFSCRDTPAPISTAPAVTASCQQFVQPIFFASPPTIAEMPIVPGEFLALAREYEMNECDATERRILDYVKTHRAVRQARERAANYKKRKEEEHNEVLRALFRQERIQKEREQELDRLGAARGVDAVRSTTSARRNKIVTFSGRKKGAPKKTLAALRERLATRHTGPGPLPGPAPASAVSGCPEPDSTHADSLREELSHLLVMHAPRLDGSPLPERDAPPPQEIEGHLEVTVDVDQPTMSDPLNKSMSCEEAQRYFAPALVTPHPNGAASRAPVSEQADSTTPIGQLPASTTPAAMYEVPQHQMWDKEDRLVNHFRLLEAIAPMQPFTQAVPVQPNEFQINSCKDDEFLSSLIQSVDEERPSLRMRITRKQHVTSFGVPEEDVGVSSEVDDDDHIMYSNCM